MLALGLIVLVTIFRLIPHPANFSPMGGVAIFSGRVLPKRYAIQIALVAMIVSDYLLAQIHGYPFLGAISLFVYAAFSLQVLLGRKFRRVMGGGLFAALLGALSFFIITNFGVWATGMLYPRTVEGLLQCYLMALPFLKMTLIGDVVWTGVLTLAHRQLARKLADEAKVLPAL